MIILLKKFFRSAIIYNMKFKGAIFDLDGTLLDSMHVWDKVDEEYFALLGKPGYEKLGEELKAKMGNA